VTHLHITKQICGKKDKIVEAKYTYGVEGEHEQFI